MAVVFQITKAHNSLMNKTIVIVLVVIGLLVSAVVGFLTFSRSKSPTARTANNVVSQTPAGTDNNSSQTASLRNLLGAGSSQVCTYEDTNTKTQGTIFVGNGRMRGDIVAQTSGDTVNSHMISDGKFVYIWTDGSAEGVKMSLAKTGDNQENGNTGQTVDLDREVNYDCNGWQLDNSKFTLPSIQFQDMSAILNNAPDSSSAPSGETVNKCQVCDSLEGEQATACKSALGC